VSRESLLRRALWVAAFFNVAGAVMFAWPASPVGALAGLPAEVPVAYRAFTAVFVLLFGGSYAWLAGHRPLNRPFVAFGAIGKTSAFVLTVALWLCNGVGGMAVLILGGDLAFAALFAWCLAGIPRG
jgi:hypothetical protein